MSSEDFHKDLISKLDPETVAKALERFNKKHSTAASHTDGGKLQNVSSKNDNSTATSALVLPTIQNNPTLPR